MPTLRQKIGQMLIMGFDGTSIDDTHPVSRWLTHDGLGGVILFDKDLCHQRFGKNLLNQEQIIKLNQQLNARQASGNDDHEHLPLFIAIDYEGGMVDRLKHINGCMSTLTPSQLAMLPDCDRAVQINNMAATLKSLGFNLNFAPALDLDLNKDEGIIGKLERSFSANPAAVTQVARQFVTLFAEHGITCCYKHFPGHGSACGDTHEGFVDVTETFTSAELQPYRDLAQSSFTHTMVMTAHVINKQLDASGMPATLSNTILTGWLREDIGFDGVIISDDLQMHAISNHFSMADSLKLTINAGTDMIIIANQLGYIEAPAIITLIEELVQTNAVDTKRIEEAYQRIIRLKREHMVFA